MRFNSRCGDIAAAAATLAKLVPGRGDERRLRLVVAAEHGGRAILRLASPWTAAEVSIAAVVDAVGSVVLDGDNWARLAKLKTCDSTECALVEPRENVLRVVNGNVMTLPLAAKPEETPPRAPILVETETADLPEFPIAGVAEAMRACAGFCAKEDTRYALSSARFEAGKGEVKLISTDAQRLHIVRIGSYGGEPISFGIPAPVCKVLGAAWKRIERGVVGVAVKDGLVALSGDDLRVAFNDPQADLAFPPYEDICPRHADSETDIICTIGKDDLIECAKAAAAGNTAGNKGVRLEFHHNKGFHWSVTGGEGFVPCKVLGQLTIGCKAAFLLQAAKVMPGDEVSIRMKAPNKPMRMDAGNMSHMLMPVNLS